MGSLLPSFGYENGRGVADTLGIETRAIVENSCGRHAWQMFASHATERKMNASSIVKPHWSTRNRAPSSTARSSASMKSGPGRAVDDPAVGELRHGPAPLLALQEPDPDRHLAGDLDAGEAHLAVAHRCVHVADREHPAGLAHRQVDLRARAVQVVVEVAAVLSRVAVEHRRPPRSRRRSPRPSGAAGTRCGRSYGWCRRRRGRPASAAPRPGRSAGRCRGSASRTRCSSVAHLRAARRRASRRLGAADRDRPGRRVDALEVDRRDEIGLGRDLAREAVVRLERTISPGSISSTGVMSGANAQTTSSRPIRCGCAGRGCHRAIVANGQRAGNAVAEVPPAGEDHRGPPAASTAAITSSSRLEPPGWIDRGRRRRRARAAGPSANGKNASLASDAPREVVAVLARLLDRDPDRVDAAHLARRRSRSSAGPSRSRSRSTRRACRRATRRAGRPTAASVEPRRSTISIVSRSCDVEVALLQQQAAEHALQVALARRLGAALAVDEDAQRLLRAQRLDRPVVVAGREQHLDEVLGDPRAELGARPGG